MATGGTVAVRGPSSMSLVEVDRYPALLEGVSGLMEVLESNIGDTIELTDLNRVSVPAGGDLEWKIPNPLGKPIKTEQLRGIVVHWAETRVWWPEPGQGEPEISGDPPSCFSTDGRYPDPLGAFGDLGDRAGENLPIAVLGGKRRACKGCPMDQFGSAYKTGARGKACKEQKLFFVLLEGEVLPTLVVAPPSSKKAVRQAMIGLAAQTRAHYSGFELGFSLVEKVSKGGGQKYGQFNIELLGQLEGVRPTAAGGPEPGSPAAAALEYSQQFGKLLTAETLAEAAAGGARDDDAPPLEDDLGGEFADHGEQGG